jgi:hypothetical protein
VKTEHHERYQDLNDAGPGTRKRKLPPNVATLDGKLHIGRLFYPVICRNRSIPSMNPLSSGTLRFWLKKIYD